MIDVTQQINAVRRRVGTRVLEAGEARTVTISQTYAAAIEDGWDACTSAERIPRWFLPVSGELKLGGRYQLEGNAGGTIEGCDPPKSFFASWEYGGEVSWVEVRLTAVAPDRTQFEIEHIAHVAADRPSRSLDKDLDLDKRAFLRERRDRAVPSLHRVVYQAIAIAIAESEQAEQLRHGPRRDPQLTLGA